MPEQNGVAIVTTERMESMAKTAFAELRKKYKGKIKYSTVEFIRFPNNEVKSRIKKNMRNKDVFLFFDFNGMPNEDLINFFLTLQAIHLAGAKRITPVIPYLPYLRQDRKDEPRSPISAALIIKIIEMTDSVKHLITVDMHSEQLQSVFSIPTDHLPGRIVFVPWMKEHFKGKFNSVVAVAPDFGSAERVRKLAEAVSSKIGFALIEKKRSATGTKVLSIIGADINGKTCFLNDDMMDTCGTIIGATKALYEAGASEVILSATHAIFSNSHGTTAYEKLKNAGVKVIVTDSLITEEHEWLTVLPLAKYMAHVILQQVTNNGSVSKLIREGLPK